jgi:hypothetical protein
MIIDAETQLSRWFGAMTRFSKRKQNLPRPPSIASASWPRNGLWLAVPSAKGWLTDQESLITSDFFSFFV